MTHSAELNDLERRLAESWPVREWRDSRVVLAVSGGADSTALLRAMASLSESLGGERLFAAHLNHGFRGEQADADEKWLNVLCGRLNIPLHVGRADVGTIAAEQGDGWEAAARSVRYEFLRQTAEKLGARYVAVAHTADDQVETVLHRILRGTGLEGLAGMPEVRPLSESVALVRPLLGVWRRKLVQYLAAIGQDYRTDQTNADTSWTRNRLRLELLPVLRSDYNSQVDAALSRLAAQAGEAQQVIAGLAAELARDCVHVNQTGARVDCRIVAARPAIIVCEVCKIAWTEAGWPKQAMGFDKWQQLAALTTGAANDVITLPGKIRAFRDGPFLILKREA